MIFMRTRLIITTELFFVFLIVKPLRTMKSELTMFTEHNSPYAKKIG